MHMEYDAQEDEYEMLATREEWQALAEFVWRYAPHLEEEPCAKLLNALDRMGINP